MDDDEDFGDEADDDAPVPLDRREAASVRRDLDDLASFKRLFASEGFKGVSLYCQDCMEDHFYGWDMLEHNLRALLDSGETPVHEPAFDPKPDEYVDWEYAQGYLDGVSDSGAPSAEALVGAGSDCPWCGQALPDGGATAAYCPACGSPLAPARIARALLDRGWSNEDVDGLLTAARVPPMRGSAAPGRDPG